MVMKAKTFKELLNKLSKNHGITIKLHVYLLGKPLQVYYVPYVNIKKYFDKNMFANYNHEIFEFADVDNEKHSFNTDRHNEIQFYFIYDYSFKGQELNFKTRNFKNLIEKMAAKYDVLIDFTIQKINSNFSSDKRMPDSFLKHKTYFENIKNQLCKDMIFNDARHGNLKFKIMNQEVFKLAKHRVRNFSINNISFYPKEK